MIHEMVNSSPSRMNSASVRPSERALGCSLLGSLPAKIEMKMMLSMPRTISMAERESRLIQPSAVPNTLKSNIRRL
jgi:hypothetical protein